MHRGPLPAALVIALGVVLVASFVWGASCGGAVACACGDTVVANHVLTSDLGPCPGHGLQVNSGFTLDCAGFSIVGLGNGSEQYGVYLRGDTGAEITGAIVRNCDVSQFLRGIRLRAANSNLLEDNVVHGNGNFTTHVGYGVEVTLGSRDNVLRGNVIAGNADEGLHLSTATGNQLIDNTLHDNYLEQLYLLNSDGNTMIGNTIYGSGSNTLYLKDSNDNILDANTFRDRTARVTGDATGNVFTDNTFVNSTLQFRVYDATPNRIPTGNVVAGGSMAHTGTCLRFTSSFGNEVSDVAFGSCSTQIASEATAAGPSANRVVSTALTSSKLSVDANSSLAVGWWFVSRVVDTAGAPVGGARVQGRDAGGNLVFDVVTDQNGEIPVQQLLEYVRVGSSLTSSNPYAITTTRTGYVDDTTVVTATQDTSIVTVLASVVSPPSGGSDVPPTGGSGTVFDNFDRANSTTLGNGWQELVGDLMVNSNELRNATKGSHMAVLPALGGTSQIVAADFASTDNNYAPRFGVVLRAQNAQNYYLVYRVAGGTSHLRISRVVNGVEKVLSASGIPNPALNKFFRLSGRASGTILSLELDGVTKLAVSDSTFAAGTVGVLLSNGSTKAQRANNFSANVGP